MTSTRLIPPVPAVPQSRLHESLLFLGFLDVAPGLIPGPFLVPPSPALYLFRLKLEPVGAVPPVPVPTRTAGTSFASEIIPGVRQKREEFRQFQGWD